MRRSLSFLSLMGLLLLLLHVTSAQNGWTRPIGSSSLSMMPSNSSSSFLINLWSDHGHFDQLIDSSGRVTTDLTSGMWYQFFTKNGQHRYIFTIITQGLAISGIVQDKGNYEILKNDGKNLKVRLIQETESLYPFPNDQNHHKRYVNKSAPNTSTITIQRKSADEILIDGSEYWCRKK